MTRNAGKPAVVAKRADGPPVDTTEIRALAAAAGYDVVDAVTQTRSEDAGTYLGSGKVAELADRVEDAGASLVAVDGELTPKQTTAMRRELPDGTELFDRYRLVLAIFDDQASSRRAQLQVELARLRYELPRIEETADVQFLNRLLEKGSPVEGVRNRIADLERKLADLPSPAEQYRRERREQGFDLVTIAGYTNAGKSTLLHRLADDMDLGSVEMADGGAAGTDPEVGHRPSDGGSDRPADDPTAAVEDRLFKTLETTTRRATLDGRPVLFTDTVGFVGDLPHWLVESFSETLSEAAAADAVVLVVDASDPVDDVLEKLEVSLDVLDAQGVDEADVVTAVNKVDLLDDGDLLDEGDQFDESDLADRLAAIEERAPRPVPVSVTGGTNVDRLVNAVTERLPTERRELVMPNCDAAMGVVSRAYDDAAVEDVTYGGEQVTVELRGRPDVVAKLEADAADAADVA